MQNGRLNSVPCTLELITKRHLTHTLTSSVMPHLHGLLMHGEIYRASGLWIRKAKGMFTCTSLIRKSLICSAVGNRLTGNFFPCMPLNLAIHLTQQVGVDQKIQVLKLRPKSFTSIGLTSLKPAIQMGTYYHTGQLTKRTLRA